MLFPAVSAKLHSFLTEDGKPSKEPQDGGLALFDINDGSTKLASTSFRVVRLLGDKQKKFTGSELKEYFEQKAKTDTKESTVNAVAAKLQSEHELSDEAFEDFCSKIDGYKTAKGMSQIALYTNAVTAVAKEAVVSQKLISTGSIVRCAVAPTKKRFFVNEIDGVSGDIPYCESRAILFNTKMEPDGGIFNVCSDSRSIPVIIEPKGDDLAFVKLSSLASNAMLIETLDAFKRTMLASINDQIKGVYKPGIDFKAGVVQRFDELSLIQNTFDSLKQDKSYDKDIAKKYIDAIEILSDKVKSLNLSGTEMTVSLPVKLSYDKTISNGGLFAEYAVSAARIGKTDDRVSIESIMDTIGSKRPIFYTMKLSEYGFMEKNFYGNTSKTIPWSIQEEIDSMLPPKKELDIDADLTDALRTVEYADAANNISPSK